MTVIGNVGLPDISKEVHGCGKARLSYLPEGTGADFGGLKRRIFQLIS